MSVIEKKKRVINLKLKQGMTTFKDSGISFYISFSFDRILDTSSMEFSENRSNYYLCNYNYLFSILFVYYIYYLSELYIFREREVEVESIDYYYKRKVEQLFLN